MKQNQPVNYIYFGIIFLVLSILHVYHLFLIENATAVHRSFYIIYAIGQCALEVGLLILLGHVISAVLHKSVNAVLSS